MSKCIAVLGANGVGKSTLVDRLVGLEGGKPPALQQHEMRIAEFQFMGESWTALDCPGSLEFLQQSMDALLAADIAVIVVSPDPSHAVLAAPFVRLAERAGTRGVFAVEGEEAFDLSAADPSLGSDLMNIVKGGGEGLARATAARRAAGAVPLAELTPALPRRDSRMRMMARATSAVWPISWVRT